MQHIAHSIILLTITNKNTNQISACIIYSYYNRSAYRRRVNVLIEFKLVKFILQELRYNIGDFNILTNGVEFIFDYSGSVRYVSESFIL